MISRATCQKCCRVAVLVILNAVVLSSRRVDTYRNPVAALSRPSMTSPKVFRCSCNYFHTSKNQQIGYMFAAYLPYNPGNGNEIAVHVILSKNHPRHLKIFVRHGAVAKAQRRQQCYLFQAKTCLICAMRHSPCILLRDSNHDFPLSLLQATGRNAALCWNRAAVVGGALSASGQQQRFFSHPERSRSFLRLLGHFAAKLAENRARTYRQVLVRCSKHEWRVWRTARGVFSPVLNLMLVSCDVCFKIDCLRSLALRWPPRRFRTWCT